MNLTKIFDEKFYPNYTDNWDDDLFRNRILKVMEPHMACLDFGAGRGNVKQLDFRGHAKFIAGVDPDPVIEENPFLSDFRVLDLETQKIDFPDNSFDIAYADNVFEHIPDPDITLSELLRVLKPGGTLMAKTPNIWHYMPTIARFTPPWFHSFYNKLRGRAEHDTFPTLYRINSRKSVARLAAEGGFEVSSLDLVEGRPEYLRMLAPAYLLFGYPYERLVNSSNIFKDLRCVLFIKLTKPM
ncbi:class I SAM-dependent methyltransferase [Akkermansiaceae bacterium]|nr:class I SAM-dependent methyltransferase [Akkermansiaceae bacterium]